MKKTTKVAALMLAVAMMMTACGGNADQAADTGAAVAGGLTGVGG